MSSGLKGWHRGELSIHRKLKWDKDPAIKSLYMYIEGDLPGDQGRWHSTNLPFLPIVTLDSSGRPWGSILAGRDARPGFIRYPRYSTLSVDAKLWPGDPLHETAKTYGLKEMLVAGLGIDFAHRRRIKIAGKITKLNKDDDFVKMDFNVNESIGNCPKYINIRDLVPHTNTTSQIAYRKLDMDENDRLPEEVTKFVLKSDTVFLGTTYQAKDDSEARFYPSHLGFNQRGGLPGFVRVSVSDGRTVYLPDYSGNRFMTSLGNIEATPYASLTFIDFVTGDILYLTGDAKNLHGQDAHAVMPFQNLLTSVHVTGYTLVRDAFPLRQRSGTAPQPSPYSPPIKYLAEERPSATFLEDERVNALLTRIEMHSASIATFHWELDHPVKVKPGQAAILDFKPLLGQREYQHMAPWNPNSVNDDKLRTWTISYVDGVKYDNPNPSPQAGDEVLTKNIALTMREKPRGLVTGALFNVARKLDRAKPELLSDSRPLELTTKLVGITGDFTLPRSLPLPPPSCSAPSNADLGLDPVPQLPLALNASSLASTSPAAPASASYPEQKHLWIAGGIGVTPFVSMLSAISRVGLHQSWDIKLLLSTREPEVILPLLDRALAANTNKNLKVTVDVFSSTKLKGASGGKGKAGAGDGYFVESPEMDVRVHSGERLGGRWIKSRKDELGLVHHRGKEGGDEAETERKVYLCGPDAFEKEVLGALEGVGFDRGAVRREGFEY
ncbi:hypothetical protein AX16_006409 [Volvariella volvacea WC 439]|nr:hypothetical protein AX16_006409 [Volvariella volvacea WC 439]